MYAVYDCGAQFNFHRCEMKGKVRSLRETSDIKNSYTDVQDYLSPLISPFSLKC